MIDIDNCGSPGHQCTANYTSCSAGICSTVSGVRLKNSQFICMGAVNGDVYNAAYEVTLPFNITLYKITTDVIHVNTSGVIFSFSGSE